MTNEFSLEESMSGMSAVYKEIYIYYMLNKSSASYEDFKKTQLECSAIILDKIHDKYADHVEGMKKEWRKATSI